MILTLVAANKLSTSSCVRCSKEPGAHRNWWQRWDRRRKTFPTEPQRRLTEKTFSGFESVEDIPTGRRPESLGDIPTTPENIPIRDSRFHGLGRSRTNQRTLLRQWDERSTSYGEEIHGAEENQDSLGTLNTWRLYCVEKKN